MAGFGAVIGNIIFLHQDNHNAEETGEIRSEQRLEGGCHRDRYHSVGEQSQLGWDEDDIAGIYIVTVQIAMAARRREDYGGALDLRGV